MQRTGPMVAVYLDDESVEKLHREYPGTNPGRLRKVVIQYNPSADQRRLYERHFGGSATVKVLKVVNHDCFLSPAAASHRSLDTLETMVVCHTLVCCLSHACVLPSLL